MKVQKYVNVTEVLVIVEESFYRRISLQHGVFPM